MPSSDELFDQIMSSLEPSRPGMFGYQVRNKLFPGEDSYFRNNAHVAGMASDSGHVILNPNSPAGVNHDAVSRNEALRLYMKDRGVTPSFDVTPEQRSMFAGTSYGTNDNALKETLAARIYSGDPSAQATDAQRNWLEVFMGGAER
jgi:hypothetical protein